ncbi:syndecan-1 [Bufo gargarizans]|uniref:syndecan-1 n=1 Tax=Bufo gargarizans TaxID=30331 RepID=UPI001CF5717E|nr:syndecan-1 [Bufo gargarizans]
MDALPLLCLLGVFCSLALAIDKAVPPEDLDASGDDEDLSGSGDDGLFVDVDSKDVAVFSTPVSTLVPTMEGSTKAQEPEIVDKEETKLEDATVSTETTKTHNPFIEDQVEVDAGDKEATASPFQQTSTAEILGEIDTRKHNHNHHPHPHHHTTTSSTTLPSDSDRPDDDTIHIPLKVDKPHDLPVNTTTGTLDEASESLHVPQELTTPVEDLAKHGVLHEDTISGSTSTYAATEEANVDPLDADKQPALDSFVTTTVAEHTHKDHPHPHPHHPHPHHHHPTTKSSLDESEFQEEVTTRPSDTIILGEGDVKERTTTVAEDEHPHHHHHHHHHHPKTTSSFDESEFQEEVTTRPSDTIILGEGDVKERTTTVAEDEHPHRHHHPHHPKTTSSFDESEFQEEVTTRPSDTIILGEGDVKEQRTTTVAEDEHPHDPHHHHHTRHHKTTPSTTEPEQPHEVHTHEPKGRRVNVPDVRSTTAVPEKDDFLSSTVHCNDSGNPFDEIDDTLDSKEEGPSGVADQDMFFEATVPALNRGISNAPASDEGTPGASQGIMERKELLAGIIAGGVAGLVFAACLVAFVLYRMKKKDEGSYSLEEPKQSNGGYQKPREQREFYA